MRSTNRKRALLTSGSVILLCMTVIIGMTFALFTDTQKINHHLQAGDLDMTLTRTDLITKTLDDQTGYLVTKSVANGDYADDVDFSNTEKNVFEITDDMKIVPCSSFIATMQIDNKSDVAFAYWFEITVDGEYKETGIDLIKQLKVTVNGLSMPLSAAASGFTINRNTPTNLAKGESDEFVIGVEFMDVADNNAAKQESLIFDLVVHAVQVTEAPANP